MNMSKPYTFTPSFPDGTLSRASATQSMFGVEVLHGLRSLPRRGDSCLPACPPINMDALATPPLEVGVASLMIQGQNESGDQYVVAPFPGGVLVAVVDGLGRGREASIAARIAVGTLKNSPFEHVIHLLLRCHLNLQTTRAAAMSIASFNALNGTMTWLGVGSVEGALIRSNPRKTRNEILFRSRGMVGSVLPSMRAHMTSICHGDTLILATDGIRSEFLDDLALKAAPQKSAEDILANHAKATDEALVLVVRYLGVELSQTEKN